MSLPTLVYRRDSIRFFLPELGCTRFPPQPGLALADRAA